MNTTPGSEEQKTYSVQLRLRRITHEDAYVSVFITDDVMLQDEEGNSKLDWEKFVADAVRIGEMPAVEWQVETVQIEPHPVQINRPDERKVVDSFYLPEA